MLARADSILDLFKGDGARRRDPLEIIPRPELDKHQASVDVRLGRWFLEIRHRSTEILDVSYRSDASDVGRQVGRPVFVPFGERYVLHPGRFILGVTLEWIRMPSDYAGYILGRSSWGRRGLIVETASGIQPGFAGSLTLEITNLGDIPLAIRPGMGIAQVFFHETRQGKDKEFSFFRKPKNDHKAGFSLHGGQRRPVISNIEPDRVAAQLSGYPKRHKLDRNNDNVLTTKQEQELLASAKAIQVETFKRRHSQNK